MIYSNSPNAHPVQDHVLGILTDSEPLSAQQLAAYAQVSQPTISRALAGLGDRVVRIGTARNTRYALKKDILGEPATHELLWNGSDVAGSNMTYRFGQMTYLQDNWLHVQSGKHEWITQGRLPWFLTPLQPKGFLGRALAKTRPDLPSDPEKWSLAQVLHTAVTYIHDPIGAFFVNSSQTSNWGAPLSTDHLGEYLDHLVLSVEQEQGTVVGSSAGGEQPKFTIHQLNGYKSIVKFSPPLAADSRAIISERWRALLMLEHLALQTLSSHAVLSARTELIQTKLRTHLKVARFDRDIAGMMHVVSLEAIHNEFVKGSYDNWVRTSQALHAKKLISSQELSQIATIFAFGHYIGNTDMHSGNLSFFVDDVIKPKIRLAPVYDMLPMMWRPDPHHGLSDSPVRQQFMPAGFAAEQAQAREWAIEFWERAAQLDIGADLQAASVESARRLKTNFAGL
jgi:HipA-like C-terminal domain